jgi:hypothetical protein
MMTDELKGTFVLVHPELPHDPANRQNVIGIITHSDLPNDDVFVSFGGEPALYEPDALLVLMPMDQIHANLAELAYETTFRDLKSLTQIDLFLRYGSENKQLVALELARDNKNIQPLCLESLGEQIRRSLSQYPER